MSRYAGSVRMQGSAQIEKAELVSSNNSPGLSPPKTSAGNPCSLALPKFDLSRNKVMSAQGLQGKTTETNLQMDRADRRFKLE